ncbi:hypothetical protein [Indioceanicola profundi]|uniref:hypothetical protein n=1 Tax=Indioceanicola profundi TaxID=2220096 RepID=UPI0013C431D3|nr:hypothetical protein [Indioceanicola profundi]
MRMTFLEKRRQLREPVKAGSAKVNGHTLRIMNWSLNGFLLDGVDGEIVAGRRFSVDIDLVAISGERFTFPAEARVARVPGLGRLAATYVCLDSQVAPRIVRHFNPLPGDRMRVLNDAAAARDEDVHPTSPPPPAQADPADDKVRLSDMVVAAREVSQLKCDFARRFHPDTAPRDETHAMRAELFKEFWDVLDAAEKRLRGQS